MAEGAVRDRVGLGWRPELAAGIFAHLDRIDVVEVLADDFVAAPRRARRALATLGTQVPVFLHGVALGLSSATPVATRRLEALARLCDEVRPSGWSEHLAFVRAGGLEIGHLAAPPRTEETVEGTAANLAAARRIVGDAPWMENVATLVDPPGSRMAEDDWTASVLAASGCDLLLDLHNLHANALNFGFDPLRFLDRIPADAIASVHLAGGVWIGPPDDRRILDDHRHDVPAPVYDLLEETARRATRPLTVVLERDGAYPPIASLLAQLDAARAALVRGRARRVVGA